MRARAAIGSILLVLMPLLAACGDDQDQPKAGDIIRARLDNQFKKGHESEVVLPTGKLLIHAGTPVDSASADETRTREKVDAPSGAVLVPISWQYDPWRSNKVDAIFDTDGTPIVDLVSGDDDYRLTPPQSEDDGAESFYVVVEGDGKDPALEITFDGVKQTVDLRTGDRDEGDAAGLYDIVDEKLDKKPCDQGKWFDTKTAAAEFTCSLTGPVLTPYAAGKWAPSGSLWLAVTVATNMRVYQETDLLGAGARYLAADVKIKPTIDGEAPHRILSTEDDADVCPVTSQADCGWSKQLVFEVPADDAEQGPLDLAASYHMSLATAWNGYDAPKIKKIKAEEKLKIWK
ncbi:hypothetical protein [Nocardioides sp. MH1]|uniref:hypothetical protein n=1 Tax=Nocardioides sp. MH1 TaxID=3242490 RepID=UPI003522D568